MGSLITIDIKTDGLAKICDLCLSATGLKAFGLKKEADVKVYAAKEMAKAEGQIQIIQEEAKENLEQYIQNKEQKKLKNISKIAQNAIQEFSSNEEVLEQEVNLDWSTRFFKLAEDIADEDMQKLWGKILSGEVRKPGTFSLRTLHILYNLTKEEADVFIKLSTMRVGMSNDAVITEVDIIPDIKDIWLMEEAGLMNATEGQLNLRPGRKPTLLGLKINHYSIFAEFPTPDIFLKTLKVKRFSTSAIELFTLIGDSEIDVKYLEKLGHFFKTKGANKSFCLKNVGEDKFDSNPLFII